MIGAIGETAEFRKARWDSALDHTREKFLAEMRDWKREHRFAWEMMLGDMTFDEKVAYAEEMYGK